MINQLKRQHHDFIEGNHKRIRLCLDDVENQDPHQYQLLEAPDNATEYDINNIQNEALNLITKCSKSDNVSSKTLQVIEISESDIPDEISFIPVEDGIRTYYVLGTIGRGAFGHVIKIIDIKSEKQLAIKRSNNDNFDHIIYEAYIMWGLIHENIVQFKKLLLGREDSFELVMECCDKNLEEMIPIIPILFESGQMMRYIHQLLSGIDYLHRHFVIHRDLKPSNILVSRDDVLKICDFGMAKRYNGHEGCYGIPVCTLNYRSPELLMGANKYGSKIDMWSVGCIVGEIIYKKAMFTGDTEYALLCNVFEHLGTPNESQYCGITEAKKHFHIPNFPGRRDKFKVELPGGVCDLLFGLLEYDKDRRLSAEEALNRSCFDVL